MNGYLATIQELDLGTLTSVHAPALTAITGTLFLFGTESTSITLPAVSVVGNLTVQDAAAFSITLPSLQSLPGGLNLQGLQGGVALHASGLASVNTISCAGGSVLASFTLDGPTTMSSDLLITQCNVSLHLPTLQSISGGIGLQNSGLTELDLPKLESAAFITLEDTGLADVAFPSLTTVTRFLDIEGNANLGSLSTPLLTSTPELDVLNNPHLPACQVAAIATQSGAPNVLNQGNDSTASCP